MVSIQELIGEVTSIKHRSEQLSTVVGAANQELERHSMTIAALVQGSQTGMNAVKALQTASRALTNAGASMTALGRTCDVCVRNLEK